MVLPTSVIYLLIGLMLVSGSPDQNRPNPPAFEILQQVSRRYRSLEDFKLEATVTSQVNRGSESQKMSFPIYYARRLPHELRIEVHSDRLGVVLVAGADTTWAYLPAFKQYLVRQSSLVRADKTKPNSDPVSGFIGMGEQLTKNFVRITRDLKKAKLVGEERIDLKDGSSREAFVIKAEYKQDSRKTRVAMSPTTYWIDKQRYLVLRQELKIKTARKSSGSMEMTQTMQLEKADLNPTFDAREFTFVPPAGARLVDTFDTGGMNSQRQSLVGQPAFDFSLKTLDGDQLSMDRLKGKVVLLDFWASWCGPCRKAHPALEKIYKEFQDDGLVVLGVNDEAPGIIRQYMNKHQYTFTNLLDTDRTLMAQYRVNAIPNLFIIDRGGDISAHLVGVQTKKEIVKALKEAGL